MSLQKKNEYYSYDTSRKPANRSDDSDGSSDGTAMCKKKSMKRNVKGFLLSSSLHGLKYIADGRITILERVLFGLSFLAVTIVSAFFISNVYSKWSASPIIITTSAHRTFTSSIPFPAVTICSLNRARKSRVDDINRNSFDYSLLMSLCTKDGEFSTVMPEFIGTWKFFKGILLKVAQPCNEMLIYCRFGSKTENCAAIFHSVLTDDGLCCTFNAVDPMYLLRNYSDEERFSSSEEGNINIPIDWTPEKGYKSDLPKNFYPRTSGGTGSRMGLTVILNASSSEYFCSTSNSIGFKILVHSPAELPKISNYGFLVTSGKEARIPIEPKVQDAVPGIRSIRKSIRRCLFSDEGELTFYRTYSRKNCELECEAKIILDFCGCILYYLPRIDPAVRICGPKDNLCTQQIQMKIDSSDQNVSCESCLPGCFELTYQATVTSTTMVYGSFYSSNEYLTQVFNASEDLSDIGILHFYYVSNNFRGTTKCEMYGLTEFLSNTGGLLGLFMGFSIFSLIEIVYFVTVRPYCANRTLKRERNRAQKVKEWQSPNKHRSYKKNLLRSSVKFSTTKYKYSLKQILDEQNRVNNVGVFPYIE